MRALRPSTEMASVSSIAEEKSRPMLLLRETDRRLNPLPRLATCFPDGRNPVLVQNTMEELVAQRVYGLALATRICMSRMKN